MRLWLAGTYGAGFLSYSDWRCFYFLHRDIFTRYENDSSACQSKQRRPASATEPEMGLSQMKIAIEFHIWSEWRFWYELMPKVDELRARYAQSGGTFLTTTLLRDPSALAGVLSGIQTPARD